MILSWVSLTIFLSFGFLGNAQVPFPNQCPEVSVVDNFDLDAYMGIWYEYSKYPFIQEVGKKCMYAIYQNIGNDTVDVENASINRLTDRPSSTKGKAYVIESGKLAVIFSNRQRKDRPNYLVLGTDYESYAVVYSCTNFTPMAHSKLLWILTRERQPSEDVVLAAKKVIDDNHLSQSYLIETMQRDCPVIRSASNGIDRIEPPTTKT